MRAFRRETAVQPLFVLVVMPIAVGVLSWAATRDLRRASLAAAVVSTVILYACLSLFNRGGSWTLVATFLVLPLTLAFALAAVVTMYGHGRVRRPHRPHR